MIGDLKALRVEIAARARGYGFEVFGVADLAAPWDADEGLRAFVAEGRHGSMTWLETTLERRAHPRALWPDARSALVFGMNYGPDEDPRALQARPEVGAISAYAHGDDYHALIKGRLKVLGGWLAARARCQVKVFVDTAPLMEKPLAEAAGLGFRGKHTNLVSREFGSWLLLGVVLTNLELEPDPPSGGGCGACRACLDACPTGALAEPYRIDARRCISYLTIEHAGPVARDLRAHLDNRIYGCDDCLAVCPWNKFASRAQEIRLQAREELRAPPLAELAALDEAGFNARFRKSPIKRIGRDRFVRNVLYAIGNVSTPALAPVAVRLMDDASPLVRGAAVWALSRLLDDEAFSDLRRARADLEVDPDVRAEWAASDR